MEHPPAFSLAGAGAASGRSSIEHDVTKESSDFGARNAYWEAFTSARSLGGTSGRKDGVFQGRLRTSKIPDEGETAPVDVNVSVELDPAGHGGPDESQENDLGPAPR